MMKHLIRIILMATLFVALMTASAYAISVEGDSLSVEDDRLSIERFTDAFDMTVEDLSYKAPVVNQMIRDFNYNQVVEFIEEVPKVIDYNNFGDFDLSSGFRDLAITTFACEKSLVGQGIEGMTIGVAVYTIDMVVTETEFDTVYEALYVPSFISVKELGASGLYNEVICYAEDTKQYVSFAVMADEVLTTRTYEVRTKSIQTKKILENIEINFVELVDVEDEPELDSFYEWFGIDETIEF